MAKRFLALFLTVLLAVSTMTVAFADDVSSSEGYVTDTSPVYGSSSSEGYVTDTSPASAFIGKQAVSPTAVPVAAKINAGTVLVFTVSPQNFENPLAIGAAGLAVTPDAITAERFTASALALTPEGALYFTLTAKAIASDSETYSVRVTKPTQLDAQGLPVSTLACVFTTEITVPPVSQPEVSSSQAASSQAASSQAASSQAASSQAASSQAASSSSQAPSSSQPEASSSQAESSSEPEASSSQAESSSEPEASSSQSESSSEPEASSSQAESSSQPEASSSQAESSSQPESSSSQAEDDKDKDTGGALQGLMNGLAGLLAPIAPALAPTDKVTALNSGGGAWTHVSGLPSGQGSITYSTKLVFNIPDDNFTISGTGSVADNLAWLNAAAQAGTVDFYDSANTDLNLVQSASFTSYTAGTATHYRVTLTLVSNITTPINLPIGTKIGFSGVTNKFALTSPLSISSIAPNSARAIGIADGADIGRSYSSVTRNGSPANFYDIESGQPGDEFLVRFQPQFFTWKDDKVPAIVTIRAIQDKIKLKVTNTKNTDKIFEVMELVNVNGEAAIRIKFKDAILTTRDIAYKARVSLYAGGKRILSEDIDSAYEVDEDTFEEFYNDDDEIDLSDGIIAIADETIRNAKVYIGEGVFLNVPTIRKGAKFYGLAVLNEFSNGKDTTATGSKLNSVYYAISGAAKMTNKNGYSDTEIIEEFPDIADVYTLHTLGLNGAGTTVQFDDYSYFYVYDADMNYLGRSGEKLPYSNKYYLAMKELDIMEEVPEEEEPYDDYDYIPVDDDNRVPAPNNNDNPSTGR